MLLFQIGKSCDNCLCVTNWGKQEFCLITLPASKGTTKCFPCGNTCDVRLNRLTLIMVVILRWTSLSWHQPSPKNYLLSFLLMCASANAKVTENTNLQFSLRYSISMRWWMSARNLLFELRKAEFIPCNRLESGSKMTIAAYFPSFIERQERR